MCKMAARIAMIWRISLHSNPISRMLFSIWSNESLYNQQKCTLSGSVFFGHVHRSSPSACVEYPLPLDLLLPLLSLSLSLTLSLSLSLSLSLPYFPICNPVSFSGR